MSSCYIFSPWPTTANGAKWNSPTMAGKSRWSLMERQTHRCENDTFSGNCIQPKRNVSSTFRTVAGKQVRQHHMIYARVKRVSKCQYLLKHPSFRPFFGWFTFAIRCDINHRPNKRSLQKYRFVCFASEKMHHSKSQPICSTGAMRMGCWSAFLKLWTMFCFPTDTHWRMDRKELVYKCKIIQR